VFENTSLLQLGNYKINKINEAFRAQRVSEIKAINACIFNPALQLIRNLLGPAGQHRADAANAAKFRDLSNRPNSIRIGYGRNGLPLRTRNVEPVSADPNQVSAKKFWIWEIRE